MADEKDVAVNFENLGLKLTRPGDVLEEGYYTRLVNMTANKGGYLETRPGSSKLYTPAFPAAVHSMGRLIVSGAAKNYEAAAAKVYRNGVEIGTGYSGDPITFEDYKINNAATPHMIIFDRTIRSKDNGTTLSTFGISTPSAAVIAVANSITTKAIDTFETASNYTGSSATVADDAVNYKAGAKSMKITVAESTTGTAKRTVALDLSKFSTTGDSDDDDYIHFWMMVDNPERLEEVRLEFDVDPSVNTFTKNYYWKAISPASITRAVIGEDLAPQIRDILINQDIYNEAALYNITQLKEQLRSLQLTAGAGQWTEFRVKKDDFTRVGGHANGWANVAAVRIWVKTNAKGEVVVNIDDGYMMGGAAARLDGDYDWRVCYRNSSTGIVSPFSATMAAQVTVEKSSANLTIPNTTNAQVDKIDIYRRGGTQASDWYFVKTIDNNVAGGTQATADGLADSGLSTAADDGVNRIETPSGSTTFAIHADRVWVDDSAHPDRLWYSERLQVEQFKTANYIVVSRGGDRIKRPYQLDDQLFVFTDKTVYRLIGREESSFEALPTGIERGLYGKHAICRGDGVLFYRGYDGIYAFTSSGNAHLISGDIDPLFHGLTVEGRLPVDSTAASLEKLEFFNNKLWYAYKDSGGTRREIVYDILAKRWEPTDRAVTSYLRADDAGILYSGHSDTYVYQRNTGNADAATAITYEFRTRYFDLGAAQQEKLFTEVVLDADPNTTTITAKAYFDNGSSSATLTSTLTGTTRSQFILPINSGAGTWARNIAIAVEDNNESKSVKFYKAAINFIAGPRESLKTITDWSTYGDPRRKYLRRLILDIDTQGQSVTVKLYKDGSTSAAKTWTAFTSTGRQEIVLSVGADEEAKIARILVEATTATPFKLWDHTFDAIPRTLEAETFQTDWEDAGFPGLKLWKQCLIEIDAQLTNVLVDAVFDHGATTYQFASGGNGQQRITQSFPLDTQAKIARLKFSTGAVATTVAVAVTAGERTVTPASMTNIRVGGVLLVDTGGNVEYVGAKAVTATTFTAVFTKNHSSGFTVTASAGSFLYFRHNFDTENQAGALDETFHQTQWSTDGTPDAKFYRQLALTINTGGGNVDVAVEIDNTVVETLTNVNTTSVKEVYRSLAIDTRGYMSRLRITPSSGNSGTFQYYGHTWDALQDSAAITKMQTEWTDLGKPHDKYFTNVALEIDTGSANVTAVAQVDGATVQTTTVNTSCRDKVYISLPADTKGSVCRLTLTAATSTAFRYYKHTFEVLDEPAPASKNQTPWSLYNWPGDKRFRQLLLEVDTGSANLTVNLEVDGSVAQTWTINTSRREAMVRSINKDIIGKIARLTFSSATGDFSHYSHDLEFLKDPLDVTRWDTVELDFGYTRWKFLRRCWIAAYGASNITLNIYADEVLKHTTIFKPNPSSGWKRTMIPLPAGVKGQLFRFEFTSTTAFKLFMDQSDVEWHPMCGERGYARAPLVRAA